MRRHVFPASPRGKLPSLVVVLLVAGLDRQLGVALALLVLAAWALIALAGLLDV